jgi:hypothetical protein
MSGHADTIRETLLQPVIGPNGRELAMRSLDELVAENQRLRDALQAVTDKLGDAYVSRIVDAYEIGRAALAGTPSEDA